MKNKMLLFLGVFAVVFVVFVTSVSAFGNSAEPNEEYLENNWNQVILAEQVQTRIADYYKIKDYNNDRYPSYFGGMYISDDATSLIIQIVKNNIPIEDSKEYSIYKEIINMDSAIKVEYIENSYNELNDVNNKIVDYFSSDIVEYKNIGANYVDVMNNTVVVELADNSKEEQEIFKRLFSNFKAVSKGDSELVTFSQGEYSTSATIKAGGKIVAKNNGSCSMGFRTKLNGKKGYVTAGHCVNGVNTTIPSGTVKTRRFADNQNYDYAFIETKSSYTPSNSLAYTSGGVTTLAVVNYCPNIVVNMAIAKVGNKSKYTSGKVQAINSTVYYTNEIKTIKGLVKSNVKQQQGDSGGVVFIPRTTANGGAVPIGVLSGGNSSTMYFTDINNLPAALQTGTY